MKQSHGIVKKAVFGIGVSFVGGIVHLPVLTIAHAVRAI
jgi:hypothetical protein